ncbi:D-alanyl-D-alanine carboxypeptidase family protein [Bacillus sp. FJAT-47783]|uniref:D-alanyl-D-alanine carboxypeptidase family protein n=1 Tax=Bacillus sp. FJAT-47783 TaxID=2922712 RepID=UPI001FAE12CF|nr:D-alanyl-D-alanine carboxypeptidase family protein [Bacillus sp. FJAT-47783]
MKHFFYKCICVLFIIQLFFPLGQAKANNEELNIQSEAAIVIDAKSGDILYEKQAEENMYPASITKIATAIFAIENGNLDDLVTVSERARQADGTRVYLEEGEVVPLKKLVQGMVINSGNDAAIAIAEHLSGSVEQFSAEINDYLQENIGIRHTHFVNPSGLFHKEHQTTAYDMAKITQYAMENETFREIFATKELPWDGETWDTTIVNHHKLLIDSSFPEVTGGKTGYVDESGNTLVTTAENDSISVIIVTLKASNSQIAYNDTIQLMNYSLANFETANIQRGTSYVDDVKQQYTLSDNVYFTKRNGEQLIETVKANGELWIVGEGDRLIKKLTLNPVKQDKVMEKETQKLNMNGLSDHYSNILIVSLLAAFMVTGFFFLEVRKL